MQEAYGRAVKFRSALEEQLIAATACADQEWIQSNARPLAQQIKDAEGG